MTKIRANELACSQGWHHEKKNSEFNLFHLLIKFNNLIIVKKFKKEKVAKINKLINVLFC